MDTLEKNSVASLITTINTQLSYIIMALQNRETQKNSEITAKFRSLTKDKSQWYGLNDSDCTLNCSKVPDELLLHFCVLPSETVLFFRDTSFWNNLDQGLVITDKGLHVIYDNDKPEDVYFFSWHEVDRFDYILVNNAAIIEFSANGGRPAIPLSFLSKGIEGCDSSKLKTVSSYFVKLLQKLADMEPCSNVHVEEVLNNATYDWDIDTSVEIPDAELLTETILKADIKQAEKIPELAIFSEELKNFEMLKDNISKRISINIDNIKKSSQNIINQQIASYNQRAASRGYKVPSNKVELGLDLLNIGLAAFKKIAEKQQIKSNERAIKIFNSMVDNIREKWIWETIEYTCSQLSLLTTTRKKLETFHLQILRKEVKTIPAQGHEYSDMLILATSLLCHAIYLELHAKDTAKYFLDMLNNQEEKLDHLGLKDCAELELMCWSDKLKTK